MTKVLYIAHYFPPIGGAGVQRSTKFLKHLPTFGIEPLVLTGTGSAKSRWTPKECVANKDLPDDLQVFRCGWEETPAQREEMLVAEGERVIREHGPDLIFVTMSPFEDGLVAAELSRRFDIPWVADLRDPWALDEFQIHRTRWHRRGEQRLMSERLRTADRIIMNTPEAGRRFREAFPKLASKASISITNGWDADDFNGSFVERDDENFRIVHSGYLHTEHGQRQRNTALRNRILGRVIPGVETITRSHVFLMKALERWLSEDPEVAKNVRLQLAGVASDADRAVVEGSTASGLVEFLDYVPHTESLNLIRTADLLFLPMHKVPEGMRSSIVPGKTYEYMATRRHVLAAVPQGDARDFLQSSGTATVCDPDDVGGMLDALKSAYASWKAGADPASSWNAEAVDRFERRRLSESLAMLLHDAAGKEPPVSEAEKLPALATA
ncbi:glycosyltransferase [Haloferula sp.]|uniref:glycosyltransferase n=1 Tax=Haloferula sp. TaxID=2497595 RepID=UPI00329DE255